MIDRRDVGDTLRGVLEFPRLWLRVTLALLALELVLAVLFALVVLA